jgi:hypothetical protein
LKEFNVDVGIAKGILVDRDEKSGQVVSELPYEIFLESDGSFWNPDLEDNFEGIRKIGVGDFLAPDKILSNLVDALSRSEETRKERMNEILMAKRIIDAMADTLVKKRPMKRDRSSQNETKS